MLTKKNQLSENELQNNIDHYHLSQTRYLEQKHEVQSLSDRTQHAAHAHQKLVRACDGIQQRSDQVEHFAQYELQRILHQSEENEQLRSSTERMKQHIMYLISKNKRQMDECSLLEEKIRLHARMKDTNTKREEQCSSSIDRLSRRIIQLQQETHRLRERSRTSQRRSMMAIASHQDRVSKREDISQMMQTLVHRPMLVRDSPMRLHTHRELSNYTSLIRRLLNLIDQCLQWRHKNSQIDQQYLVSDLSLELESFLRSE